MSAYPKSFSYVLSRFQNLSRQKYRLVPSAQTSFGPNDQLVMDLPVGLLALDTFTLQGLVSTSATGGTTPSVKCPPIEEMIENITVEVGGIQICSISNYAQLYDVFRTLQMADKYSYRQVLQLEQQPGALATSTMQTNVPWAMYNFLGFIGSNKVLDTTLLPQVRLYIRWASSSCLSTVGSPTSATYSLTNVSGTIDVLDIADGIYSKMVQSRLQSAPLEVPFKNYTVVVGSLGAPTQSTRFSTSAHCLEKIIAFPIDTNVNDRAHRNLSGLSTYFRRNGSMITDSQFMINSVPYPAVPATRADAFVATSHVMNLSQDTVGASHPNLNSLDNFANEFWVHALSLTWDSDGDSQRLCGIDARGGTLVGSWNTNGSGTNFQPCVVLVHSSVLRIGPNRTVELVL